MREARQQSSFAARIERHRTFEPMMRTIRKLKAKTAIAEADQWRAAFLLLARDLKRNEAPTQNPLLLAEYLEDIYRFLEKCSKIVDCDPNLQPLSDLMGAISDLDNGCVDQMLRPKPVRGRPPETTQMQLVKIIAANACDMLMRFGSNRTDAAKQVAAVLCDFGLMADARRPINHSTVLNWRSQLRRYAHTLRDNPELLEGISIMELTECTLRLCLRLPSPS
jgi:hypothetical protein